MTRQARPARTTTRSLHIPSSPTRTSSWIRPSQRHRSLTVQMKMRSKVWPTMDLALETSAPVTTKGPYPGALERDQRLTDSLGSDHQNPDKLSTYRYGVKARNLLVANIAPQDGVQVLRILHLGSIKLKDRLVRRVSGIFGEASYRTPSLDEMTVRRTLSRLRSHPL